MKFLIVAQCTMRDEVEFEHEPTGPDMLMMMEDVNKRFKEKGLKVQVNRISATHISDPIEEDVDRDI